jgi:hypothetical protein
MLFISSSYQENRISALVAVLAGICTRKVLVAVLSEPKSKTATALFDLVLL